MILPGVPCPTQARRKQDMADETGVDFRADSRSAIDTCLSTGKRILGLEWHEVQLTELVASQVEVIDGKPTHIPRIVSAKASTKANILKYALNEELV